MLNYPSGNMPTPEISSALAEEFVMLRAKYNYPKAYIIKTNSGSSDIRIAPGLFARFEVPDENDVTDLWLDEYHTSLVRSESADERLLGLASIVYWGFYTFSDNFSRKRVSLLLDGSRAKPRTTPAIANLALQETIKSVEDGSTGAAVSQLGHVSQLGEMPFASKVVAFVSPCQAGVFDNRIGAGLKDQPWAFAFQKCLGNVGSVSKQRAYQSWCTYLSLIASCLNGGIAKGNAKWRWSCGTDRNQLWRALDVERAIFAKYAKD